MILWAWAYEGELETLQDWMKNKRMGGICPALFSSNPNDKYRKAKKIQIRVEE